MGEDWNLKSCMLFVGDEPEPIADISSMDLFEHFEPSDLDKASVLSTRCDNIEFEFSDCAISMDDKLMSPLDITYKTVHYIQKRKHRKKRINKKWAKRYGHIPIERTVATTGWEVAKSENGEFELRKEIV